MIGGLSKLMGGGAGGGSALLNYNNALVFCCVCGFDMDVEIS